MFTPEQKTELAKKLDPKNVKSRPDNNMSYIEGWHAIGEANRIFGFGNWSRETVNMKEACPTYKNKNNNNVVSFLATVRITVCIDDGEAFRDGTGFGSGISGDLSAAYEGAVKEAETDAMKRALMTFGNQFGLALYDKTKKSVGVDASDPNAFPAFSKLKADLVEIQDAGTLEDLEAWRNNNIETVKGLPKDLQQSIATKKNDVKIILENYARDAEKMAAKAQANGFPDAEVERPQA